MDRDQLRRQLDNLGVRKDSYSLDGPSEEAYCLDCTGGQWEVYYYERGIESGKRTFAAEVAACDYLLGVLMNDPSVKTR